MPVIDKDLERVLSLDDLRKYLASKGTRFSWDAIYRWTARIEQKNQHGELVQVGGLLNRHTRKRHHLESFRRGGKTFTSLEAYARFEDKLQRGVNETE